ncbi:MAG: hypothetical protein MMC23_007371 [Stictis urceolatum]|nr:hypothetical protein [Stictis urceolata]
MKFSLALAATALLSAVSAIPLDSTSQILSKRIGGSGATYFGYLKEAFEDSETEKRDLSKRIGGSGATYFGDLEKRIGGSGATYFGYLKEASTDEADGTDSVKREEGAGPVYIEYMKEDKV